MGLTRRALAAGCTALALLALPAVASATVRSGQAADLAGDSAGPPSQDLAGVIASYDDVAGSVGVAVAMNGAISTGPRSALSFTVASFTAPDQCGGPAVTLAGFSDGYSSTVTLSEGASLGAGSVYRRTTAIEFDAQDPALKNRSFACVTVKVSSPAGTVLDTLDVPLYFKGLGPDGDADGVVDNVDGCPTVPGPAPRGCLLDSDGDGVADGADQCPGIFGLVPTGCPGSGPILGPPTSEPTRHEPPAKTPACKAPSLKGKTLSAARKALSRAGCRLGKVTKPKKIKKGAKLVVKKQSGKNPVAITLVAAKKK